MNLSRVGKQTVRSLCIQNAVDQFFTLQVAKMLPDGEKIRQNLGGVEFVGQAVPHGHTGVGSQSFHDLLAKTTVFDAVIHPTQHTGGVSNGLLLTQLGAAGIQIGGMHTEIGGGHLECTTGAGGGFFEDQGDGFTLAEPMGDAGLFLGLQISTRCELLVMLKLQQYHLSIHDHLQG